VLLCDGRLVCGCADPYGKRLLDAGALPSRLYIECSTTDHPEDMFSRRFAPGTAEYARIENEIVR
jgi:hypothetical protein